MPSIDSRSSAGVLHDLLRGDDMGPCGPMSCETERHVGPIGWSTETLRRRHGSFFDVQLLTCSVSSFNANLNKSSADTSVCPPDSIRKKERMSEVDFRPTHH